MAATTPPPRLTSHQRTVLGRLARRYRASQRPVPAADLGCAGALNRLRAKGYAEVALTEHGPRGGTYLFWAPTDLGRRQVEWRRQTAES